MYLNARKKIYDLIAEIDEMTKQWSSTKKLAFAAMMACLAGVLQAMGGLLPGVGFLFSPFATLPILLCTLVSLRFGCLSYLAAIGLLLIIRPDELFIFPFTTGLLGISLGGAFRYLRKYYSILLVNGVALFLGICFPLYVFGFPVFGPPSADASPTILVMGIIFLFSLFYSLLWVWLGPFILKKLQILEWIKK